MKCFPLYNKVSMLQNSTKFTHFDQNADCESMSKAKYWTKKVPGLQLQKRRLWVEGKDKYLEKAGEGREGTNGLVTGEAEVCGHTEPAHRSSSSLTRPGIPDRWLEVNRQRSPLTEHRPWGEGCFQCLRMFQEHLVLTLWQSTRTQEKLSDFCINQSPPWLSVLKAVTIIDHPGPLQVWRPQSSHPASHTTKTLFLLMEKKICSLQNNFWPHGKV